MPVAVFVFNQQLLIKSPDHRGTLQIPLEGRTIFQMYQTTPENQGVLRHVRERGQDSNLDRDLNIRVSFDCQKAVEAKSIPLHNSTDFERDSVRENPYFASTYGKRDHESKY